MKSLKFITLFILTAGALLGLNSCKKEEPADKIEDAIEEAGDAVEDAAEELDGN